MICRHWAAVGAGPWRLDSKAKLCWRASGVGRRVSPDESVGWRSGFLGILVGRAGIHPVRAGRPGGDRARVGVSGESVPRAQCGL